jgi:hypothetical protein
VTEVAAQPLGELEKRYLLRIAREALRAAVEGAPLADLDPSEWTPRLAQPGSSFVSITLQGDLRGCLGTIWPRNPLAEDVRAHAAAVSSRDLRFPPVTRDEVAAIRIELSVLTPPQLMLYSSSEELLLRLSPGRDGVVLRMGAHQATFLPKVWERVPEQSRFLSMLSQKAGLPEDVWCRAPLEIWTYRAEDFGE